MTPTQELRFEQMAENVEAMTKQIEAMAEEQKKVTTYLFVKPTSDQDARADQLDRVFTTRRGYQFSSRLGMSIIGFFLMVGTLLVAYDSVVAKIKGDGTP